METLKNISLCVVISAAANLVSRAIDSTFIPKFLASNLVLILISLLAISVTTLSVIMTKVKEIKDKFGGTFKSTINAMKESVVEQLVLVGLGFVAVMVYDSPILAKASSSVTFLFDTFILSLLVFAIYILHDTASAIFDILNFEDDDHKEC